MYQFERSDLKLILTGWWALGVFELDRSVFLNFDVSFLSVMMYIDKNQAEC